MRIHTLTALLALLTLTCAANADDNRQTRDDWQAVFDQYEAAGTAIIVDERSERPAVWVHDKARADTPLSPASTYKVPHSLFALDAGVVRDEFQVFKWDGVERGYAPWNMDQTLRSSMRHSVVWVYERIADELGEDKARDYLTRIHYGNAEPTTSPAPEAPDAEPEPYWVNGNLHISAADQIAFLRKLYRNELPFKVEHQRLVKDIMIVRADRDTIVRAKTGWTGQLGWWVGWVEHPNGAVFFALNIDTPNRYDDLPKRQDITIALLKMLNAWTE